MLDIKRQKVKIDRVMWYLLLVKQPAVRLQAAVDR